MKKILFVQPIFCPDEIRTKRNIDSILSISEYYKKYPYENIEIVFGGWTINDDYWNEVSGLIKEQFDVDCKRFDRNVGKATIVNDLVKGKEYDYLLTMDSDIVFSSYVPNMFKRLISIADKVKDIRNKPFGLVSLNQTGQCCHLENTKENSYEFENKIDKKVYTESIRWPNGPSGVAGGCLFLSKRLWDIVGGYKVFGVYAGDDAHMMLDCHVKGFSLQIIETISIIHPHDNDVEYQKWKVKVCQRDTGTGVKRNINKQIEESENFWESHSNDR